MKKIVAIGMLANLLAAGLLHAQEAAVSAVDPNAAAGVPAAADTNAISAAAEPKPPEDAAKNMIARIAFDVGIKPESAAGGFEIPVVFQRESPAWLNGRELGAHMPRLVAGKFGQGLLVESAYANLYSPSQAGAEEASIFKALNGADLTGTAGKPWEGKQALAVATKGEAGDEGLALELKVDKALYNGNAIVPASYVASVYLKGQGNLKLFLKDMESDKAGETVYVDLTDEWKRFACVFSYPFPAKGIGAKHADDWKTLLPPGTNIEARLQMAITTTDSSKTTFYADGLQLEARDMPARTGAGPAPHAWIPGGTALANETLTISTKDKYFGIWRTNGTVSFWFLPNWEARDGTQDTPLQIVPSLMTLQHVNGKLQLAPAGTAFTPSDWQNAWHHIAVTWNAEGQWVLYVDGMDYPGDDILRRPMTAAVALICGSAVPPTAPNGIIDDLMLFQIALAPEQVQALFAGNLLKPGETPPPSAAVTNTSPAAATDLAPAATNSLPATMPAATNSTAAPEPTPAP